MLAGVQKFKRRSCVQNPVACTCKNGKYLGSIIDDSVITCDEIIDAVAKSYVKVTKFVLAKTVPTKSTSKKLLQQISIFF